MKIFFLLFLLIVTENYSQSASRTFYLKGDSEIQFSRDGHFLFYDEIDNSVKVYEPNGLELKYQIKTPENFIFCNIRELSNGGNLVSLRGGLIKEKIFKRKSYRKKINNEYIKKIDSFSTPYVITKNINDYLFQDGNLIKTKLFSHSNLGLYLDATHKIVTTKFSKNYQTFFLNFNKNPLIKFYNGSKSYEITYHQNNKGTFYLTLINPSLNLTRVVKLNVKPFKNSKVDFLEDFKYQNKNFYLLEVEDKSFKILTRFQSSSRKTPYQKNRIYEIDYNGRIIKEYNFLFKSKHKGYSFLDFNSRFSESELYEGVNSKKSIYKFLPSLYTNNRVHFLKDNSFISYSTLIDEHKKVLLLQVNKYDKESNLLWSEEYKILDEIPDDISGSELIIQSLLFGDSLFFSVNYQSYISTILDINFVSGELKLSEHDLFYKIKNGCEFDVFTYLMTSINYKYWKDYGENKMKFYSNEGIKNCDKSLQISYHTLLSSKVFKDDINFLKKYNKLKCRIDTYFFKNFRYHLVDDKQNNKITIHKFLN